MSLLLGLEPFKKFGVGEWWLKGIVEFRFGPNLGLRLEAGTKQIYDKSNIQSKQNPIN